MLHAGFTGRTPLVRFHFLLHSPETQLICISEVWHMWRRISALLRDMTCNLCLFKKKKVCLSMLTIPPVWPLGLFPLLSVGVNLGLHIQTGAPSIKDFFSPIKIYINGKLERLRFYKFLLQIYTLSRIKPQPVAMWQHKKVAFCTSRFFLHTWWKAAEITSAEKMFLCDIVSTQRHWSYFCLCSLHWNEEVCLCGWCWFSVTVSFSVSH